MKILYLDIETAPNTAYVWGLWKETVNIERLIESRYVLSWAAKWKDSKEMMFDSVYQSGPRRMLRRIAALLDEADVVVHYNGKRFDIPTLNTEFVKYDMPPPSPYDQVDLYQVVKRIFKFTSNKLDYVVQSLGIGHKVRHPGFQMWVGCMAGDESSWKSMERYNKMDVVILERLYKKLLPWIPSHPNHAAFEQDQVCPQCGGKHWVSRGYQTTKVSTYHRYRCKDCFKYFRGNRPVNTNKQKEKFL